MSSEIPDPRRWIALILLSCDAVHAHHRRLDRQRRVTDDRTRSALHRLEPAVGGECLRPHVRRLLAARRPHGRPARASAPLHGRVGGLHGRVARLRLRDHQQPADRGARGAGPRWRDDRAGGALDPLDDVRRGRGAQQGARSLGRRLGCRRRGGRAARRRAHRVRRLGVGLLRQCADRHCRDPARPAPAAREPRRGRDPLLRRRSARSSSRRASRCSSTRSSRPTSTTGSRPGRSASSPSRPC